MYGFPLQALAFRGRSGSLLDASRLWGLPWPRFSRRSLVPSVPINLCFKRKNCWLVLFQTLFKTRLFFIFFPVILNGWKKYATLLPKNWLAETPETLAPRMLGRQSAKGSGFLESTEMIFKKNSRLDIPEPSLRRGDP
ncbi:hypothetical protein CON84_21085 [Bacillus sp. AFS094228]|nr:hypothetical protein CON84_21085 [Bacillus sp. AFS094228]